MRAVEDLHARALVGFCERERNRPQARVEVLVGQPGNVNAAVEVRQVRDRFAALAALCRLGKLRLGEVHVLERELVDLAFPVHFHHDRRCIRPAAARQRQVGVARRGVDGQVVDQDFLLGRAEHGRDLTIDAFDLERAGSSVGCAVARVDGKDGRALGIAQEQDSLGTEGQWPSRLHIRRAFLQTRRQIGRLHRPSHKHGNSQGSYGEAISLQHRWLLSLSIASMMCDAQTVLPSSCPAC